MSGEILAVGTAAKWSWDNWPLIQTRMAALKKWWYGDEAKSGILIVGPGGVGKSTLGKLLSGGFSNALDIPSEYRESLDVEKYNLGPNTDIEVKALPGQSHRRDATWAIPEGEIAAGKYRGVVLFASYGYHALGISYKNHRLYKSNPDQQSFLNAYLNDRREDEVRVLERLVSPLTLAQNKMWLLTVITKQDLWWNDRNDVFHHYDTGGFGAKLRALTEKKNSAIFRSEIAKTSLIIGNFVTTEGELLQPNTAGYDQGLHAKSLKSLIETIAALQEWEQGK